ncbi:MAG: DUF2249 domain-containing protein [Pseudomonadota bacterium]
MAEDSGAPQEEVFLDLRGLDPPEPLVRILAALEAEPARPLRVRMSREPWPLYAMLAAGGWQRHTRAHEDGGYEILIRRG